MCAGNCFTTYILDTVGDNININEGMRFSDIYQRDYMYGLDFAEKLPYEDLLSQLAASYVYKHANEENSDADDEEDSDNGDGEDSNDEGVDEFGSLHIVRWVHPLSPSMLFKVIIVLKRMSIRNVREMLPMHREAPVLSWHIKTQAYRVRAGDE